MSTATQVPLENVRPCIMANTNEKTDEIGTSDLEISGELGYNAKVTIHKKAVI